MIAIHAINNSTRRQGTPGRQGNLLSLYFLRAASAAGRATPAAIFATIFGGKEIAETRFIGERRGRSHRRVSNQGPQWARPLDLRSRPGRRVSGGDGKLAD